MKPNSTYTIMRYNSEKGDYEFTEVHPLDESLNSLKERFNDLVESNQSLQEKLKEIKDEKWADKRLQEMNEELEKMRREYYRGFPIRDEEQKKIDEWLVNHHHYGGAIGGTRTYEFSPTSIGTIGKIKCMCGEEFTFVDL